MSECSVKFLLRKVTNMLRAQIGLRNVEGDSPHPGVDSARTIEDRARLAARLAQVIGERNAQPLAVESVGEERKRVAAKIA